MFMINTPWVFRGFWSVIKGFLHERTLAKIKVRSSGTVACMEAATGIRQHRTCRKSCRSLDSVTASSMAVHLLLVTTRCTIAHVFEHLPVQVLGSDYKSELLAVIPEENLPVMFGGRSPCEMIDVGPWQVSYLLYMQLLSTHGRLTIAYIVQLGLSTAAFGFGTSHPVESSLKAIMA